MISISKTTVDSSIYGNTIIKEDSSSEMTEAEARLVVVPTLDGGSVMLRAGVTESDRQLVVIARITANQETILNAIFKSEARLMLSWGTYFYIVSIKKIKTNNGQLKMTLYIDEQEI